MDLFELSATLGLDTNPFTSALGGVKNMAMKALGEIADLAVDFGKDVLKTGMGFDKQMSAVQAVLGREEGTLENMNSLRAFALDQARDSIFTAEQTAEAYYYMGMAGWKTQEMLGGLPGIMALAAASGEDLGMVSDIVTDSLTAFGWEANRASEFADILAQAATNSNTDVKRMGETFKYIAPIAGSLGVEVEDVALSIGLLASQGIKGSMAGTALRNILVRLSTNAGQTNKDLGALTILTEKLGVQFWDSSGKMRDFSDIIREARVSWQGLTQEEQTYYAKQIGSQRGMAAWMALMNAAEEDVNQLAYAFANAEGAAQSMADVKLDNLWGDIQMFNSSLDVLKVALFDDVKSPLRDIVQYGTDALDRIRDAILEDGLIGGIRQLGTELRNFGKEYKDEFKALGEAIMPVLHEFINTVTPAFLDMATSLGSSFGSGVFEGLKASISDNWLSFIFGDVGPGLGLPGAFEYKNQTKIQEEIDAAVREFKAQYGESLTNGDPIIADPTIALSLDNLTADDNTVQAIQNAIDTAIANGDSTIDFNGLEFDVNQSAEDIASVYIEYLKGAGTTGGAEMAKNADKSASDALSSPGLILQSLISMYGLAGKDGGNNMVVNISNAVSGVIPDIADMLTNGIGNAGYSAGNKFANSMQEVLNRRQMVVNTVQNVVSNFVGKVKKNASAMESGRIFKRPTIFGYDDGAFQMAGDAGAEAVIGVNSLADLISKAVQRGNDGREIVVPRSASAPQNIVIPIIIDGREFARATVPYIEAEQHRVGFKLSGGYA